ncbi:HpcH/HpaI aldolase/citrate lyase family protein [Achromobacter insolitus]|uniref:Citrate lyase subunit beta n=1 Tax=Achromobacter insolitus TaxID=217204 RepID=A0A6S7EVF8_9BURK|nr:aldolase/citrate lyase family protein [Achromobacter insolitus]APX74404.1 CoA ester lyase [Achromobacter insolitus]OWT60984.1 CoA ester lyase [Achromobacter insolitus]CAB3688614.1 Citrate lyase subunit beta [Achromobacter insolitus]CAB3929312.1 Citrate lyase subunit beta [Achromobacter insolitus]CAB3944642.1 Citrate lyase subunit beta [Achromobacter insolitus]
MTPITPSRRPPFLRRSWMFVPGLDAAAQADGLASGADALVADLEEFTAAADRPAARPRIAELFASCRAQGVVAAVRINKLEDDGMADLRGVMPGAPDAVFLPHAESPAQIAALDQAITALEAELGLPAGSTEIVPTLESALGVHRAYDILTASPRVSACLLAAEDLTASLGAERGKDGIELHHLRARFLLDCTAAGCLPIDCPFNYRDMPALEADVRWARRLGLKSKCATVADQVKLIHAVFTPAPDEVAAAHDCVARYEAQRAGRHDAERIDPPVYNTARRLLARHHQFERWAAERRAQAVPQQGDSA